MKSDDAKPPFETTEIGTPLDYTEDLYRFYLEVRDTDGQVERLLRDFVGSTQAEQLQRLTHGFELTLPIQCVPDIVRLLTNENIAIYQIVRYAKVAGAWR
ncbi:MAG: hypothetical protein ABJL54_19625 [Halioglobus sp.]